MNNTSREQKSKTRIFHVSVIPQSQSAVATSASAIGQFILNFRKHKSSWLVSAAARLISASARCKSAAAWFASAAALPYIATMHKIRVIRVR